MILVDKQSKFLLMLSFLIQAANRMGYHVTAGCLRCPMKGHHMPNSLHYIGLAADLNLFKDGTYLTKTEDHKPLGELWELWGGSWGGRFNDGNHYSLEYRGRR